MKKRNYIIPRTEDVQLFDTLMTTAKVSGEESGTIETPVHPE